MIDQVYIVITPSAHRAADDWDVEVLDSRPEWPWDEQDQIVRVANVNGGDSALLLPEPPEPLDETSPALASALAVALCPVFGKDGLNIGAMDTGGGCSVCFVDLSIDGRGMGRQIWLTRETASQWVLGFYDWAVDEQDEGVAVMLPSTWDHSKGAYDPEDYYCFRANDPVWVAEQVAAILTRLGVDKLQGE